MGRHRDQAPADKPWAALPSGMERVYDRARASLPRRTGTLQYALERDSRLHFGTGARLSALAGPGESAGKSAPPGRGTPPTHGRISPPPQESTETLVIYDFSPAGAKARHQPRGVEEPGRAVASLSAAWLARIGPALSGA